MLKLELVKSETVRPSLWPTLPRGVEVIEEASGLTTSLREPVGLKNVLELRGRVVLTIPESITLRPLRLFSADSVVGEGEWQCFWELRACRDFTGSLGLIPEDEGVS